MKADSIPQDRQRHRRPAGEAFILMAMTLVAAAVGSGLYVQLGMGLWNAVLSALAVYLGLVVVHALVRRSQAIRDLSYEVDRLESEVMRIAQHNGPALASAPDLPNVRPLPSHPTAVEPGQQQGNRPPPMMPGPTGTPGTPPPLPIQGAPARATMPGSEGAANSSAPEARNPQGSSMSRLWSVRPTDGLSEAPSRPGGRHATPPLQAGAGVPVFEAQMGNQPPRSNASASARPDDRVASVPRSIEDDVSVINNMIRRLSEETGVSEPTSPSDGNVDEKAVTLGEDAIAASVDALRAAAEEMRRPKDTSLSAIERGILPPFRINPESEKPQPPPVGPDNTLAAQLAGAITNQTLDVFLEPILGLADRKVRHYEISLRLRSGTGSIGPEGCFTLARNAGMLPLLDASRVSRASMVARYLDERSSGGCLFAALSAESLSSERFLGQFAEICRQTPRLRERLVFSLTQGEVRGLTPAQWSTVKQLAESGFRFAIEDLTSIDLDLPELKAAGFAFMRIPAQALIDGIASLDGTISAAEVCRRLAGSGLTLMSVDLETEEQLDGILGAGVPLGQGPLFGLPRPVKGEALRQASSAAA